MYVINNKKNKIYKIVIKKILQIKIDELFEKKND